MTPGKLKKWMAAHDKSATDVASLTGVALTTVQRFLSEEIRSPHRLTMEAFETLVSAEPVSQKAQPS
jgi:hypothetical protein